MDSSTATFAFLTDKNPDPFAIKLMGNISYTGHLLFYIYLFKKYGQNRLTAYRTHA